MVQGDPFKRPPPNRGGNPQARGEQLTQERVKEVDEKLPSPKDRAEEVHAALILVQEEMGEDLSRYDVLCFAVQYVGMMALGALEEDEDLEVLAKGLNRWLHHHHYFYAEDFLEQGEDNG